MTPTSSVTPQVLRCATSSEFLGVLPHLTGLAPEPGILLVLFRGSRAEQSLRFPLPSTGERRELRDMLSSLSTLLGHSGAGKARPAIVIYTDESFAPAPPRVTAWWEEIAEAIAARMLSRGWPLREFCVQASDAWAPLLTPGVPIPRELSEISLPADAAQLEQDCEMPRSLAELAALPEARPSIAAALAPAIADLVSAPAETPRPPAEAAPLFAEYLLAGAGTSDTAATPLDVLAMHSPISLARLLRDCAHIEHWLIAAVTILTSASFVPEITDPESGRLLRRPLTRPQGDTGGAEIVGSLLEIGCATPRREQMQRAARLLHTLIAHAPRDYRPGALALLAWIWWELGMLSLGERFIEQALSIDPNCQPASIVRELLRGPPQWLVSRLRQPPSETAAASA